MKRSSILSVALGVAAILLAGCVTQRRSTREAYRPRAFALAVTVDGGLQPTPAQWAAIQAVAVKALAAKGAVLVTDLALADMIIRVNFSPDPLDPEHSGRAVVLGFRANPRRTLASSPAYSYTGMYHPGMSSTYSYGHGGYYGYNGYNGYDRYSDGYIYDTPTGTFHPLPPSTVGPRRDPPANNDVAPVFAGTQGHQQGHLSSSDRPVRAPRNIIEPGWRNSSSDYHSSSSSSSSYSNSSSGSSGSSSSYSGSSSSSSSVSSPAASSVGESNGASHTNLP
ncbi:MAG: hypothetical protein Q7S40_05195 [Opitutaceae bacterium]|nr:hypothetical protein [Opitutaceae bacterium]